MLLEDRAALVTGAIRGIGAGDPVQPFACTRIRMPLAA